MTTIALSPREVSEMLGICYRSILFLIRSGRIRHTRLGHRIFILREHVLELFGGDTTTLLPS